MNKNGILSDEMIIGKIIQVTSFLEYLVNNKKISGPFLILTSSKILSDWKNIIEQWTTFSVIIYKNTLGNNDISSLESYEF